MNPRPLFLASIFIVGVATAATAASSRSQPTVAQQTDGPVQQAPAPRSAWTTQWGGFNHFEQIHAVSADSVWAVGSNAVHFDGRRWLVVDRRDYPGNLSGVDLLPDGTGWIIDGGEAVPIRRGVMGSPTHVLGYQLSDVEVVSENDAWALARPSNGGPAVILRYRDGGWLPVWTAPDNFLHLGSIWMASANEGWAVGSTAVYYNGETWTEWSLPIKAPEWGSFNAVSGTAPNDVWIVGGNMLSPPLPQSRVILHFDGSGWSVVRDEPGAGISAMAVRQKEGIAVTLTGDVFKLHDGRWEVMDIKVPHAESRLGDWVIDASFVPGTPYALLATNKGWIYKIEDDQVTLVHDAAAFNSIAMLNEHQGWALGRRAMEFDGADWRELPDASDLHRAIDIATTAGNEAWAVGKSGLVLRYRADRWERMEFPSDADLHRVVAHDPGIVWVLSESTPASPANPESVVLTYDEGSGWREVWRGPGASRDLAVARGQALVATNKGVWHFDEVSWSRIRDTPVVSVGIGPSGELWAGDDSANGSIQEFDGRAWVPKVWLPGQSSKVTAFHMGTEAMWAVAHWGGFVLAYDGEAWRIVRGDPEFNGVAGQIYGLRDIATAPMPAGQTGLWAVGEPDTIIHSTEAEVLGHPAITPPPTDEPDPTPDWSSWRTFRVYLPRVELRPAHRSPACRDAASAQLPDVERTAWTTAAYYSAGGPIPEPALRDLHMLTVGEMSDRYGVNLVGAEVAGRRLGAGACVWWASFEGRFDCKCDGRPTATPSASNFTWTRLDLSLFGDDASVIYEDFSGQATPEPPTPTTTPEMTIPPITPIATPRPSGGG
jgi:hypothetical protein